MEEKKKVKKDCKETGTDYLNPAHVIVWKLKNNKGVKEL